MKTIAIANHKGGSAKTTSTYYLGCLLAEAGLQTLLIDLDAQANLTGRFSDGIGCYAFEYGSDCTIADALGGAAEAVPLAEAIVPVAKQFPLHLAASEMQLANTSVGLLNDAVRGRTALRRALAGVAGQYAVCLIDCPPEAGILLVNALLAADIILCPAEPERDALDGIQRVVDIANHIRTEFERSSPTVFGTIATRVDSRTNRHRDGLDIMRRSTSAPLRAIIPAANGDSRDARLRESYSNLAARLVRWVREGTDA